MYIWGDWLSSSVLSHGDFHWVCAGPLVKDHMNLGSRRDCGYGNCYQTDEPRIGFGRAHVATAHTGQHVWFAGGVEVTGDGPQGNVISLNQADPRSKSHLYLGNPKTLPSLRPLADVDILNVDTGSWAQGNLSSARFGVSGVGVDRFVFFAGGAQLGSPDVSTVVDHLKWEVNVSSCHQECMKRNEDPHDWGCQYRDDEECNEVKCIFGNCKALPMEKTAINSDIVEVFDVLDVGDSITKSQQQLTLSQARRFAASGMIPDLNLVLFAGGVTANEPSMPDGGWLPTQRTVCEKLRSEIFRTHSRQTLRTDTSHPQRAGERAHCLEATKMMSLLNRSSQP